MRTLARIVADMGFYKVYGQTDLENSYTQIKQKFPAHCSDPRCVIEIGSSLNLDRMLYGSVDKNASTFGVRLFLLDVPSKQIVEHVELEGEPGAGASGTFAGRRHKAPRPSNARKIENARVFRARSA